MVINDEMEAVEGKIYESGDKNVSAQSEHASTTNDSTLVALVNQEQTLACENLREKLGREPSQEETDEWLNAHTESY